MTKALEIAQVPNFLDANTTALVVNATSYNIGSSFTANTTGVYTGVVNATSYSIGSSFTANTTGAYHTGTVNAASVTTTSNTANFGTSFYSVANGNVGIGTSSPIAPLTVASSTTLAGGSPSIVLTGESNTERIQVRAAGAGAGGTSVVLVAASRGTVASPTAIQSGEALGYYQFGGYNGTGWTRGAWIQGVADGAYSATNQGSYLVFSTTPTGSTSIAERARITSDGFLLVGTTTTTPSAPFGGVIFAGTFKTIVSSGSLINGASATLFTIGVDSAYLVTIQTGNASGLSTTAIVKYVSGGNPATATIIATDSANFTITISGTAVRVTNNLGGPINYSHSSMRIF